MIKNLPRGGTAILTALLALGGCARETVATRTTFQMNTAVVIQQLSSRDAEAAADALVEKIGELEQTLSMHRADTDVARVNADAGMGPVAVGEETAFVIRRAQECAQETQGLFDITVGALTSLWGVTSDHPRVPDPAEIEAALPLVGYESVSVEEKGGKYFVSLGARGQEIDLGGVAKGYALDACRTILDESGASQALVSIGGNVLVYKDKGGEPFTVGIRYPEKDSGGYFCAFQLRDTVVSTTGGYERFFEQDGVSYHHVMDPATGYPAQSDIVSVSVIMQDGLRADCTSTALFVGGLEYALGRMRSGEIQAVVLDGEKNVYVSASLGELMVASLCDDSYNFVII